MSIYLKNTVESKNYKNGNFYLPLNVDVEINSLDIPTVRDIDELILDINNGNILVGKTPSEYKTKVSDKLSLIFDDNILVTANPFAHKGHLNFYGVGQVFQVYPGLNQLNYTIPSGTFKFQGLELLNSKFGDSVNLKILDDINGTYSGYPNATLNQFGFDFNMKDSFCGKLLPYDAELHQGMIVNTEYTSNESKEIRINYTLHKVIG